MGQPVTVIQKQTSNGLLRFEVNRSLTGMGHERYRADRPVDGNRPPDVLARRLFEHGGINAVHVYSSVITIDPIRTASTEEAAAIKAVIEDLFIHYRPGVEVPKLPEAESADA